MNENNLFIAILLTLPKMGPSRIRWLTQELDPDDVLHVLADGEFTTFDLANAPKGVNMALLESWKAILAKHSISSLVERCTKKYVDSGVDFLDPTDELWPFVGHSDDPLMLFYSGDKSLLAKETKLAIIGTRRCSSVGRNIAFEIGRDIGALDVPVVSGLALGVDGSAHTGALSNSDNAIGVVGSGLDVVYPKSNTNLWNQVSDRGLLVSESPLGATPQRWRFPARNRIIAQLSTAVLVVESHKSGGSLLTVDDAIERDKPVLAIPGSVTNPASDGTNQLICDGATMVRGSQDVIDFFGLTQSNAIVEKVRAETVEKLSDLSKIILSEIKAGVNHAEDLFLNTNATIPQLMSELAILNAKGIIQTDGMSLSLP